MSDKKKYFSFGRVKSFSGLWESTNPHWEILSSNGELVNLPGHGWQSKISPRAPWWLIQEATNVARKTLKVPYLSEGRCMKDTGQHRHPWESKSLFTHKNIMSKQILFFFQSTTDPKECFMDRKNILLYDRKSGRKLADHQFVNWNSHNDPENKRPPLNGCKEM